MLKRSVLMVCALLLVLAAPTAGRTQTVSEEAKAAAKDLMVAMRATEQFEKLMPIIVEAIKPAIVQGRPEVERDYPQIAKLVLESFASKNAVFIEALSLVYARHFTPEELREVAAFMRRPIGQKFVEKMPLMSQESMLVGQRIGQQAAAEMQAKIVDELRKRGHKI